MDGKPSARLFGHFSRGLISVLITGNFMICKYCQPSYTQKLYELKRAELTSALHVV